jgi:hypothetical protein
MDKGNGYVHKYYGFYFRAKQGLSYEGRSPSNSIFPSRREGIKGWGIAPLLTMKKIITNNGYYKNKYCWLGGSAHQTISLTHCSRTDSK